MKLTSILALTLSLLFANVARAEKVAQVHFYGKLAQSLGVAASNYEYDGVNVRHYVDKQTGKHEAMAYFNADLSELGAAQLASGKFMLVVKTAQTVSDLTKIDAELRLQDLICDKEAATCVLLNLERLDIEGLDIQKHPSVTVRG
jgi:hypothetical protein